MNLLVEAVDWKEAGDWHVCLPGAQERVRSAGKKILNKEV